MAGTSLFSSGDGYVRELLELHQGCQGPFEAQERRWDFSRDATLKRASSRIEGRISLFFLSCGRKLGIPLELHWGPLGPALVYSGKSSLHVSWERPQRIPFQSILGPKSSTGVEAGASGFLSSAGMDPGVNLEFPKGRQTSSLVEACKSAFLSSWKSSVRLPVGLT